MAGRNEKGADFPMPIRAVPYRHQMEAFRFACGLFGILPGEGKEAGSRDVPPRQPGGGCALLMEMGTGKTLTTIGITGALANAGRIRRVLVVAPLSIVGVWEEEFRKFADFLYCLVVLSGNGSRKRDTLRHAHKAEITGVSFSVSEGSGIYVPFRHRTGRNVRKPEAVMGYLQAALFGNVEVIKIAHNLSFESMFLYALGVVVQAPVYDTIAAAQLTLKSGTAFRGLSDSGLKKSTLLNTVQEILLGSENVSNIPWQNLGDRFNKAELFGKLANIFADLPSKSIDDNGMFKALTGEDFITAERKNKDPFSFRPYARFLFSCNEIPRNYGDRSEGFYRRLIIIRFEKSVPKSRRDPNLSEKLAAERDGILMWALSGLKRLIAADYDFSETERTRAELERYRVESNSVLSFAKMYCERREDGYVVRDDLFLRYKEYCGNAGMKPVSQTNFNKELEAGYPEIVRGRDKLSKRRVWKGMAYVEGGVEAD